jgi:hypothetical protein
MSEEACCAGAGIHGEPELGVAIALGIVYPQRLGEIRLCADEIALEKARHTHVAARDRRLGDPPLGFGVAQETLRGLPPSLTRRASRCQRTARNRRRIARSRRRLPPRASGPGQTRSSTRRRRSLGNTSSLDPGWSEAPAADSPQRSRSQRVASRRRRPCPPWRSPCRDGRSPPERPSGARLDRPLFPTIRSRARRGQPQ